MGFTYKGIHSSVYLSMKEPAFNILPPIETNIKSGFGRFGAIYMGSSFGARKHDMEIIVKKAENTQALALIKRDIAAWLRPDFGPGPLVFDDEPDKTYTAVLDGESELKEVLRFGFGSITFISPDPAAYSSESNASAQKSLAIFKRNSVGYSEAGARFLIDLPRFQPAKFDKGITIEEGKTNLMPNNDFSDGLNGLDVYGAALVVENAGRRDGARALQINDTVDNDESYTRWVIPVTPDELYTLSVHALIAMGTQYLYMDWLDAAQARIYADNIPVDNTNWERIAMQRYAPANAAFCRVWLYSDAASVSNGFWSDLQLEAGELTTWTPSIRAAEKLTINTTNILLGVSQGTIMFAFNRAGNLVNRWHYLIDSDGANRHLVAVDGDGVMHMYFNDVELVTIAGITEGPQRLAYTWSGQEVKVYIDGVLKGQQTYAWPISFADVATLFIGSNKNMSEHANGYIDDLVLSPRAWTPAEIAAQTNQTATVIAGDYKFSFDASLTYTSGANGFDVNGTIAALPTIEITVTKPINELIIDHLQSGRFIKLGTTFGTGDVIIVNCEKRHITINGTINMLHLDLQSRFFELEPGINQVTVTPGDSVNANIKYKARWL